MLLPADFDNALWLSPMSFQGLVGAAIARCCYGDLFRDDGFAKPIAELRKVEAVADLLPELERRDQQLTGALSRFSRKDR